MLSYQGDNNDDPTVSSNPLEPPAGDNSSNRTWVGAFADLVGSFTKNSTERWNDNESWSNSQIWSNNERRNDNYRPLSARRYERYSWDTRTPSYHLSRDDLRIIALSTLQTLEDGEYFPPGHDGSYDLRMKINWTHENTRYYGPDAGKDGEILESEFIKINERGGDEEQEERDKDGNTRAGEETNDASSREAKAGKSQEAATAASEETQIYLGEYSTLVGARKVHFALATNTDPSAGKKIGVLNFASAKKPGGGFINGSQAQEESIARSSTLYPSLITHAASPFYAHYPENPNNAYYTHAMVYSPAVVLLRDDDGEWRSPVEVDVLTSAAVNAGEIRSELEREERVRRERMEADIWKKRGEERRKKIEKAAAERRKLMEEAKLRRKEKEDVARSKKEHADFAKSQKKMLKSRDGEKTDEGKATHKGKAKNSDGEKETSVEQEKADTEVGKGKGKGKEAKVEKPEENQEENATDRESRSNSDDRLKEYKESKKVQDENATDSSESGSSSDSPLKELEENKECKRSLVQDDRPQPEALPEVSQEPTSSSIIIHPLLPQTQPSQAYLLAVSNTEMLINQTMYARISRILHLFQLHQTRHIILGSFGTGVFQNRTDRIAAIFADLLVKPGGRFKNVFKTVVFAILGKETMRVFSEVFTKVDKQAQKGRGCKDCVFWDGDGGDGDVREGEHEKNRRMMQWNARRNVLWNAAQDAANAAAAQDDIAFPTSFDESDAVLCLFPPSFEAAEASAAPHAAQADTALYSPFSVPQASAVPHAASFTAAHADAAAYPASFDTAQSPSFDVPQATAAPRASQFNAPSYVAQPSAASCPPSSHDGAVPYPTTFAENQAYLADARAKADIFSVQDNPTADGILEDEEMILTGSDGQVNLVAKETDNTPTTPKTMIVDEGKDVEMIESKGLSARHCEARNLRDGDIEMQ